MRGHTHDNSLSGRSAPLSTNTATSNGAPGQEICRVAGAPTSLTIVLMNFTDVPPPIEYGPPYSMDFVAHLHGGCYLAAVTPMLLRAVRRDADGARMLDALTTTQLEVRLHGNH